MFNAYYAPLRTCIPALNRLPMNAHKVQTKTVLPQPLDLLTQPSSKRLDYRKWVARQLKP